MYRATWITFLTCTCSTAGLHIVRDEVTNLGKKLKGFRETSFYQSIPKVIHQTWKDHQLPPDFDKWSRTWKECLPDWEYKLHTDKENRNFVKEHFPELLETYDGYKEPIQRVDVARYAYLAVEGGLYVDLDVECLHDPIMHDWTRNLADGSVDVLLANEDYSEFPQVSNSFMLSSSNAGKRFFRDVVRLLPEHKNEVILWATGPQLLTKALLNAMGSDVFKPQLFQTPPGQMKTLHNGHTSIAVVDDNYVLNIPWNDTATKQRCLDRTWCMQRYPNAVSVSHWSGSWLNNSKQPQV